MSEGRIFSCVVCSASFYHWWLQFRVFIIHCCSITLLDLVPIQILQPTVAHVNSTARKGLPAAKFYTHIEFKLSCMLRKIASIFPYFDI